MTTHSETSSEVERASDATLMREKSSHIIKAARSATLANILAPLLCIPMFQDEVPLVHMQLWLGYMFLAISIRTWIIFRLPYTTESIQDPQQDLGKVTIAIGMVGLGWGLGWPLMTPDLSMVNRMIYVYMTTAAMISSMFAYSVNKKTFYAFTLPIMIPAMTTLLWPVNIFPWPFSVGMGALYLVVISIGKNFATVFESSVRLRFRNEHLYQALASERDQSVAANVAKSKFIAVASHDLRQPLHAVNVNLDLFNLARLDPRDSLLLQRIKNSIMALNDMFDGLLNMSKLDAYVTTVSVRDFPLRDLSGSVREIIQPKADQKRLALSFDAPDIIVRGDKLLLQQIVVNLAFNALQYTEHGQVDIQFSVEGDRLVMRVSDTGVGISPADQKNIFNEFYRVERTRGAHDGLGLGLTIVKRLCDLMDATIAVESLPGKGSVFIVHTPCTISSPVDEAAWQDQALNLPPHNTSNWLEGKCIAIFEDDQAIAEAYRHTLSARGAQTFVLSDADDELNVQLESINHIDCILSDYQLKYATGDLMIDKLRENYNREIPAVIVTGDTARHRVLATDQPNIRILHKPVTFIRIVGAIEEVIQAEQPSTA